MEAIKTWSENIIIVVIITIIIEMILPDGNSKKYVKVVSGLYLLYVIINPIVNFDFNIDSNEIANLIIEDETVSTSSSSSVEETYISSLEASLKIKIEELRI